MSPPRTRTRSSRRRRLRKPVKRRRFMRRKRAQHMVNNTSLMPLAPRYITRLKYNQSFVLTSTLGSVVSQIFNLNSLFDPDRTGVGHQPMGYDQLTTFYTKYRVFACSWRVNVVQTQASSTSNCIVVPINTATSLTGISQAREQPRAIYKMVNNANGITTFTGKMFLPNLAGSPVSRYKSDDIYASQTGSSPSELMTLQIIHSDVGSANNTCTFDIELVYHSEFFDPAELPQS